MPLPRRLTLLSALALLASCAPALTQPQGTQARGPQANPGRIVNGVTGEEGRLSFTPGSLRPSLPSAYAPDNVVIEIGGQTYRGRAVVLNAASPLALPPGWGLSLGFGASAGSFAGEPGPGAGGDWNGLGWNGLGWNGLGWRGQLDSAPARGPAPLRSGNLIARTAGSPVLTLTCTLSVDPQERGIGECTGSDGARYALQF